MIKKAVFPAAGLGTRFLPLTKSSPKEMLPLVDKPLIHYCVEEAVLSGIENIIIITGMGKTAIEDYFDISLELERNLIKRGKKKLAKEMRKISDLAEIFYVRQKETLGLGHAILCARSFVGQEAFAVILADDIIDAKIPVMRQMIQIYNRMKAPVLAVERVPREKVSSYGIIKGEKVSDGVYLIKDVVEKPPASRAPSNLGIIGRYILTPEIFDILDNTRPGKMGEIQLTDAIRVLLNERSIYAYEITGERYDCGDKAGFIKANLAFSLKRGDISREVKEFIRKLNIQ